MDEEVEAAPDYEGLNNDEVEAAPDDAWLNNRKEIEILGEECHRNF